MQLNREGGNQKLSKKK